MKRVQKRDGEFFGGFKLSITEISLEGWDGKEAEEFGVGGEEAEVGVVEERTGEEELAMVADTGRIFVKNLSYIVSEEDLQAHFQKFGDIAEVVIPVDRQTERSKGYGIVTFVFPEHALKAFSQLDGTIFKGRMLHLLPGREKPGDEKKDGQSFKDAKSASQKAKANSPHNWNALFIAPEAVGETIASELGVSKGELLSTETDASLGVRLALGETQVVRQTRSFLLQNGVALDRFQVADAKRSKTVVIAKNLPARTTESELRDSFGKFGGLGRVVLPPSGLSALIEFLSQADAKTAFKKLAYTRFKTKPFFLQWAPDQVFSGEIDDKPSVEHDEEDVTAAASSSKEGIEEEAEETKGSTDVEPQALVYVRNLNFETQEEDLRKRFTKIGPLVNTYELGCELVQRKLRIGQASVTVATKAVAEKGGQRLSCGYGFLQFRKAEHAKRALAELQGTILHGHALELFVARRESGAVGVRAEQARQSPEREQGESTKILVRNLAFQASEQEIRELFAAFGSLRSVRLPRKLGSKQHRGFGFVDFGTKTEALKAVEALGHSTHLYGRRLVLEWAKEEETLQDVRKRTSQHFLTGENRARKGKEKRALVEALDGKKTHS